jgi:asparagine synthase (glutamine-hydrolysing)
MCGITGIVSATPQQRTWFEARIAPMTQSLVHRGPDACGYWSDATVAFGHRRLSIIDLSEAGRQPMQDDTGRFTLIYNGELYNCEELRRDLVARGCRFQSRTDSEVLLYAYREWGAEALDRCNGMWAFAIWDSTKCELFAARDRAGKKPFYYTRDAEQNFFFASEVKAFRAIGMRFGLDPQAAFDFLSQGTYGHLHERGFFSGVQQLLPGHCMTIRAGDAPDVRQYWELPVVRRSDRLPYDDAFRQRFRELVEDAVRVRLRADVPVGATLSGGLDSSTIVGIVDRCTGGEPLHIFTSLYPNSRYDETPYFEAAVATLKRPIVHRVTPPSTDLRADILSVLDHQEEPFGDTSILAHFHLMRAARDAGVPVILSGQGGDELLFGYPSMVHAYLGDLVGRGHPLRALREARLWMTGANEDATAVFTAAVAHSIPLHMRDWVRRGYARALGALASPSLKRRVSLSRFETDSRRDSLSDYAAQVFTRFAIPHLVHYDDRNAMAFSIEGRMPFLDHRLVDLLFTVDYEALVNQGTTKRVLRETFADVLPDVIVRRRDKVGFHTPLASWLRHELQWVGDTIDDDRIRELGVADPAQVRAHIIALCNGDDRSALPVWRTFVLHLWAQRFGSN